MIDIHNTSPLYKISILVQNNPEGLKQLLVDSGVDPLMVNSREQLLNYMKGIYETGGMKAVKGYMYKVPYLNDVNNFTGGLFNNQSVSGKGIFSTVGDILDAIYGTVLGSTDNDDEPPPPPPSWWSRNKSWAVPVIAVAVTLLVITVGYFAFRKKK